MVGALMSKESGVIVVIFVACASLCWILNSNTKIKMIVASTVVLVGYLWIRSRFFDPHQLASIDIGYGAGIIYDNWVSAISPELKIKDSITTVLANLTSPVLPIYDWKGKVLPMSVLVESAVIWFPTAVLFCLSWTRNITMLQKYALIIVAANALIHFVAFRYRLQYISWLGICCFIAGSRGIKIALIRATIVKVVMFVLLISSLHAVSIVLHNDMLRRHESLNRDELRGEIYDHRLFGRIDSEIVEEILGRYKKQMR
jgi:hypothetical protein